jgi:hypothetical protein
MVQFRVQDVTFRWSDGFMIPNIAPLHLQAQAHAITLWLDNQKNGQCSVTIHHTTCPTWCCPIKVLAKHVASILAQGCDPTTNPLSFVSPGIHVTASNITALVHQAALDTHLVTQGYHLKGVRMHLLRAPRAMALKIQGINDSLIMASTSSPTSSLRLMLSILDSLARWLPVSTSLSC